MISAYLLVLEGEEEKNKFERLFHTYYQSMLKEAYLVTGSYEESEEVVQEVFFKVTEIIDKFPKRACKREHSLLIVMTKNKAIDLIRKKGRRLKSLLRKGESMKSPEENDPEEDYIRKETELRILTFVEELPKGYRDALVLHIADGWKARDIAEFLDIDVHVAEMRLIRGKEILKKRIAEEMKDSLPRNYQNKGRDKYEQTMGNGV